MSVKTEFETIKKPLADYAEALDVLQEVSTSAGNFDEGQQEIFAGARAEIAAALDSIRVLGLAFEIARQP